MLLHPTSLTLTIATAALVLACGCGNAARAHDPAPALAQEVPVKRTPKPVSGDSNHFAPDPAYVRSSDSKKLTFSARIGRDQPLALPREPGDAKPAAKVPAAFKRKSPLVLDVGCVSSSGIVTDGEGTLSKAVTIEVFADTGAAPLATFAVARDCAYSQRLKVSLWTDIGAVSEYLEDLRMPLDDAIDARLRDDAMTELTAVALDAQGRTMLVEKFTGLADSSDVYAGAQVVSVIPHSSYETPQGHIWARSFGSYVFDRPVALPPADGAARGRVPARFAAVSPLVLDLMRMSPSYQPDAPLSKVVAIHLFAKGTWKLLGTVAVAQAGRYTATTDVLSESVGTGRYLTEHLRAALDTGVLTYLRTVADAEITAIAVDKEGRTVVSETLYPGDQ